MMSSTHGVRLLWNCVGARAPRFASYGLACSWLLALVVGSAGALAEGEDVASPGQATQSGNQTATAQPRDNLVAGGFVKRVSDPRKSAQRLGLAKNRSVVVETTIPIVRVETAGDIVEVSVISSNEFVVTGIDYGVTQVMVWSEDEREHMFEVNVELDLDLLNATFRDIDPQSDARAISVVGNVLLVGTVSGADMASQMENIANLFLDRLGTQTSRVENNLRVAGEQQVMLKVTVAEISRSAVRNLGINGFLAGEDVRDGFVINQLGGINPTSVAPPADIDVTGVVPFLTGDISVSPNTTLTLGFPRASLEFFIRAMADNTLLRILAEPTLVAISGESASFLAGGEFPVPVPQSGAATGAITIEYKEFGINLDFTPIVLPHQRIRLRVSPEVSTRDETRGIVTPSGFVPALTTRRTETTVEVESGSTLAIAGLLQDEIRGIASRVPGIGDLPVLGALFRSINYQRLRTELVILVTPEIVAALTPDQVPEIPGGSITDPTDIDLYLNGILEGEVVSAEEMEAIDVDEVDSDTMDETDDMDDRDETARRRLRIRSAPNELALHGSWGYASPRLEDDRPPARP